MPLLPTAAAGLGHDELDALGKLEATLSFASPFRQPQPDPKSEYSTTTARSFTSRAKPTDLTAYAIRQRQMKARKRPRKALGGAMDGGYKFDWVTANQGAMQFDAEMQRHCVENERE